MKNSKPKSEKPYHELPDCSKKLLRICVQAKLLPQSAHQVYLAITDRFNSTGELTRECFEGTGGISRRVGLCKKQTTMVADGLVALGFLKLRYRVWLNDSKKQFKDFEKFDEATSFQQDKSGTKSWHKQPTLVRVYSEPDAIPTPGQLGLTLENEKDHIYSAPENLRWTAKKNLSPIEENHDTSVSEKNPARSNKRRINDTNLNDTNTSVTKETVNINRLSGEDVPSPHIPNTVSELITVFKEKYNQTFDRQVPAHQISSFVEDAETVDAVHANLLTVISSGGTPDGWIDSEFERMKTNVITGKYRSPKLNYLKNNNSLNAYLDSINGQKLKKASNPFSEYLSMEEFKQCLTISPEDDHLLIRNQVILNSYNENDIAGIKELTEGLTNYSDFFEVRPSTFVYVTIKHLAFERRQPRSLLKLAKKFSLEANNSAVLEIIQQEKNLELITKARSLI